MHVQSFKENPWLPAKQFGNHAEKRLRVKEYHRLKDVIAVDKFENISAAHLPLSFGKQTPREDFSIQEKLDNPKELVPNVHACLHKLLA